MFFFLQFFFDAILKHIQTSLTVGSLKLVSCNLYPIKFNGVCVSIYIYLIYSQSSFPNLVEICANMLLWDLGFEGWWCLLVLFIERWLDNLFRIIKLIFCLSCFVLPACIPEPTRYLNRCLSGYPITTRFIIVSTQTPVNFESCRVGLSGRVRNCQA